MSTLRRPIGLILAGMVLAPLAVVIGLIAQDPQSMLVLLILTSVVSYVGLVWLTLRLLWGETPPRTPQDGAGGPVDPTRV